VDRVADDCGEALKVVLDSRPGVVAGSFLGQVGLEDAGRRSRQEVLVDDGLGDDRTSAEEFGD
jgi:hypothetical protein